MKKIFLLILSFLILSCERNDDLSSQLKGTWVEKTLRHDTIIFDSPDFDFGNNWFDLRRGVMLSTGPYEYKLKGDSISVHWMLSSCMCWETYYFKIDTRKYELMIGKFYDSEELEEALLTFVRTW